MYVCMFVIKDLVNNCFTMYTGKFDIGLNIISIAEDIFSSIQLKNMNVEPLTKTYHVMKLLKCGCTLRSH